RMVVNTSNKCTFKGTTMPTGTGTVRAILSYYRSDWQLVISDPATDCIGFDPMGEPTDPDTPSVPGDAVAQISADFEDGQLPAGWTAVATSGDRTWFVKDFNSNFYAQCSAYKGKAGADGFRSWLITSAVDIDKMTEKVMSFETEIQYGPNEGNMQLYVLDSNDPSKAQMVEMTYTQPQPTSASSSGYVFSGEIDLSQFTGVKYIGWLYIASDPDNSRTYRIDNVKIGFKADQKPDIPDTPATGNAQFRKVTGITSGKSYVLVVDGKVGGAIPEKDSYGRLAMADPVSAEGDVITTAASNGIVFTAVEGGYTMTDAYGRFLSMDNSHLTSFQIYTSQQAGSVWGVSFNADGSAAIVNTLNTTCNVVRSGTYTNIAPSDVAQYPEFTAPVLYEKVD
ncbi:MAG: choice-of-anchor J domain-containing protein, partial [Duncaniella sp.]|nr:choice-of-anchor J domain-containing protein [Duncaniella sp.]